MGDSGKSDNDSGWGGEETRVPGERAEVTGRLVQEITKLGSTQGTLIASEGQGLESRGR